MVTCNDFHAKIRKKVEIEKRLFVFVKKWSIVYSVLCRTTIGEECKRVCCRFVNIYYSVCYVVGGYFFIFLWHSL